MHVRRFRCAILLCDHIWVDPDMTAANGVEMGEEDDMLRLDSMMLMMQLNLRQIVEVRRDLWVGCWAGGQCSGPSTPVCRQCCAWAAVQQHASCRPLTAGIVGCAGVWLPQPEPHH